MKCHYEVLSVTKEASGSEIKKAYRKLALQWHPDKNLDNLQEAKEQFQLVQNAYEVLSDPQERAWYDNHREQLLRGAGSSYNDDSLDVYPYFSPSCYKGFGDDPQGFFAVYAEVFSKLASEEADFLEDPEEISKIPKFGVSTSPYEDVNEFYAFWMSFSTNKSYVWLDQYEISQGDNRRVIKLMEKENNKIRQKARKERNEEIRRLVSFVRRKDKRVIEHTKQLQEKVEENKKKAEQLRRKRIIERQKEIEEAKKKEGESSFLQSEDYQKKLSEIESLLAEEFGLSSDDDTISEGGMESSNEESSKTEEIVESYKKLLKNLYCSACNKIFKNVNSFENHENSRKHKENVASMTLGDDIPISEEGNDVEEAEADMMTKINGDANDGQNVANSTSDTEDNDIRETLSDDSDKIQVSMASVQIIFYLLYSFVFLVMLVYLLVSDDALADSVLPKDRPALPKTQRNIKGKKLFERKPLRPKASETEDSSSAVNLRCLICQTDFPSKNKLFEHLKKTGHSVALPQTSYTQKKGKKGNR
nr:dnaJ homolog subfamily C member 21-like [Danaus plexippus plexippus]